MAMQAIQHGKEHWIIGRNPRPLTNSALITGELGSRVVRTVHDGFWTGENWGANKTKVLLFGSEQEANNYIAANKMRMGGQAKKTAKPQGKPKNRVQKKKR